MKRCDHCGEVNLKPGANCDVCKKKLPKRTTMMLPFVPGVRLCGPYNVDGLITIPKIVE